LIPVAPTCSWRPFFIIHHADIGFDTGTPVSDAYELPFLQRFVQRGHFRF